MKNFIRGMGVGILITTLVFGTAYMLVGRDISDSEIKERAGKLGMVEEDQSILKEDSPEEETADGQEIVPEQETADGQETVPEEETVPEQETVDGQDTASGQDVSNEQETVAQQEEQAAQQTDNNADAGTTQPIEGDAAIVQPAGEKVSVTINRGQDGISVSRMLQENGVVTDAADFNRYLSENKYQMDIRHGTFELEKNMDYAAIVQQIVWH